MYDILHYGYNYDVNCSFTLDSDNYHRSFSWNNDGSKLYLGQLGKFNSENLVRNHVSYTV